MHEIIVKDILYAEAEAKIAPPAPFGPPAELFVKLHPEIKTRFEDRIIIAPPFEGTLKWEFPTNVVFMIVDLNSVESTMMAVHLLSAK